MNIHNFIATKRDGRAHTAAEIGSFVGAVASNEIPDYQISAWLMAAYLNGLTDEETNELTIAMAESGETLPLADIPQPIVDKHSTGGVGDTTTFLLLPLLASCGITSIKLSGRGLGFTGGTIDKLSAIPGFRYDLSPDEMVRIAKQVGCALSGQSANLAPADKKLYALRDATETVSCLPLIAASVMSKKLAVASDGILLDVKCGSGAFMKTAESATALAKKLVSIGNSAGRTTRALVSDMNQPLNKYVGNALEIRGALESLDNGLQDRLGRVVLELANAVAEIAGSRANFEGAISSGKVQSKLDEWIRAQGGDPTEQLPKAPYRHTLKSESSGHLASVDCEKIGEAARLLGAGRIKAEDEIDHAVGIVMRIEVGDSVDAGQDLLEIHARSQGDANAVSEFLLPAFHFSDTVVEPPPLIHARV